jgi:co-chaperonin GroES (HSP10)
MKISKVIGDNLVIKRFKFPLERESGLVLPAYLSNEHEEVGTTKKVVTYQNRGEVIAVGDELKGINVGDIVVFSPKSGELIMENPDDLTELHDLISGKIDSDYLVLNKYAILYVE